VLGEMENYLQAAEFTKIVTYFSFDKKIAADNQSEMFCMNEAMRMKADENK